MDTGFWRCMCWEPHAECLLDKRHQPNDIDQMAQPKAIGETLGANTLDGIE